MRLDDDPHRPRYHFLPPANWMNDPNGLIQWQGRYHLFYQCNPFGVAGPGQAKMHWGHAVSDDLVRWDDLPIALAPTPGSPDEDGCWSGCAVDADSLPAIVYSGHRDGKQHTCLAWSRDDLLIWEKDARNPVIPSWPDELDLVACRDPAVWRETPPSGGDSPPVREGPGGGTGLGGEPEDWYQLLGAGLRDGRGAALLYRSRDLVAWEYQGPLLVGERETTEPIPLGTMWECPGFFPLADCHCFFVAPKDNRQLHRPVWFVGGYVDFQFVPERIGLLDHGNAFYAPQAMADESGRRLLWGWLREARSVEAQRVAGWSGVMSLPRVLSLLPDGTLGIEPAEELAALRGAQYEGLEVDVGSDIANGEIEPHGRALEIIATWDAGSASAFGLDVACSPDGAERTRIRYEPATDRLSVDRRRSSLSDDGERDDVGGAVGLPAGEPLTLRIFLDHSVVEIFANGRACHATRIYPTGEESEGIRLFAEGGTARLTRLDVWQLAPIWEPGQVRSIPVATGEGDSNGHA